MVKIMVNGLIIVHLQEGMMMWLNPLEHLEHPFPKAMHTECIWCLLCNCICSF